jgi:hypothetical protein
LYHLQVIAALAAASAEPEKGKKKKKDDNHIPFRDSVRVRFVSA